MDCERGSAASTVGLCQEFSLFGESCPSALAGASDLSGSDRNQKCSKLHFYDGLNLSLGQGHPSLKIYPLF